jgi:chemotaxis protein methyltransferase CheR
MAFTFFFRDTQVLEYAVREVVPFASGRSRVRMWDAGCAMGPEPYTLAIMLAENMGTFAFKNLCLDATDIDRTFEETVIRAEYADADLQRIPQDLFRKYFEASDRPGFSRVVPDVRGKIRFKVHDLLSLQPAGEGYCLVVCKNVLLHFNAAERIEVLKMFHRSLAPGGYLANEHTQKMPAELAKHFEQVTPDAQLYRKLEVPL